MSGDDLLHRQAAARQAMRRLEMWKEAGLQPPAATLAPCLTYRDQIGARGVCSVCGVQKTLHPINPETPV